MSRTPLSELRPQDFPKIGDEENAFDSYNEDTDNQGEEERINNNEHDEDEEHETEDHQAASDEDSLLPWITLYIDITVEI